ncbi:hypothetical protein BKI52_23265 [marine bacterium AO1-C]|nr:hypothetical protein BKI52_23265 [marine bacterium AO1-C]
MRQQKRIALAIVTLAIFVDIMIYSLIIPLLPQFVRKLGLAENTANLLYGSYAWGLLLVLPLAGWASDRFGRRMPMIWGLIGLLVSTFMFMWSTQLVWLIVARVLQGVSAAFNWTAGLALLADFFPKEERGKAMGIAFSGTSIANLVGPPLSGWLFDLGGLSWPFIFAAILVVIDLLARVLFLKDNPNFREVSREKVNWKGLLAPLNMFYFVNIVIAAGVISLLEPTLSVFLDKIAHFSPQKIGFLFGAMTLTSAIFYPLGGYLSDKFSRIKILTIGFVGMVIFFGVLPLQLDDWYLFTASAMIGVFGGLHFAPIIPAISDNAEKNGIGYGALYAIFNLIYTIGIAIGPLVAILITVPQYGIVSLASVGVFVLVYGWMTRSHKKQLA